MKVIFSTNFRPKPKKSLEPFLRIIAKYLILGYFGDIFTNISKSRIFLKIRLWLFYLYIPLTSCKKSEKSLEPFQRKLLPTNQPTNQCWFGELFANISKSRIFFKNPALWLFYLYSPLTSCKKIRKNLRAVCEKTALPNNKIKIAIQEFK